jgi:prephenate dehydratase
VYLWPDNIIINNINKDDIPIIYKLITNNIILTKEYINTIDKNNKFEIIQNSNNNIYIISSLSKKIFLVIYFTLSAIASPRAAKLYDLPTLATDINDYPDNCTRFWVLGTEPSLQGTHKLNIINC